MRQSQLFLRTLKEIPKDAQTVSSKLLLKGDFISQTSAGIYSFLPLGWFVHQKIEKIIREEMKKIGAQEVFLPALISKNFWQETDRWKTIDPPLFKVKDRHQKEFGLGSTHEEIITHLIRKRISSYKDLPIYLFQIQNKFRNEMRPSGGLLRTREFIMKDLYSFHTDYDDLFSFYKRVKDAYFKIFKRCGLEPLCVQASSGTIGGETSEEFMVISEAGEDRILICPKCDFKSNIEKSGKIKKCPLCGVILKEERSIEVGHLFNLGDKYSKAMNACFVDKKGNKKFIIMGCYGIGLGRLLATVVEVWHDKNGIIWPKEIAPFDIHLIPLFSGENKKDKEIKKNSENLYDKLRSGQNKKFDVLYDDREQKSNGEKLIEADLLGIPLRIVISKKTIEKKAIEIKPRNKQKTELIKIKDLNKFLKQYV